MEGLGMKEVLFGIRTSCWKGVVGVGGRLGKVC